MENTNVQKTCRICGVSSAVNKFKIKDGQIYGRRCLKCISKINNDKLRNRASGNYYTQYYQEHKEIFKARDKERYAQKKALKNLVVFNLELERLNQLFINEPDEDDGRALGAEDDDLYLERHEEKTSSLNV